MPEQPNRAANFQGGTSDYWDGLLAAYYLNQLELASISDSMTVIYTGTGGEAEASRAPHFAEDAQMAGAVSVAGEIYWDF